jgi:hypothetical protein
MSVLLFGVWLAFNAALFAALWFRRPNPKLRAKLFNWVVRGRSQRRLPPSSLRRANKAVALHESRKIAGESDFCGLSGAHLTEKPPLMPPATALTYKRPQKVTRTVRPNG